MVISHVFVCGGVGCWGGFLVTLVYEKRFEPITIPVTGHISIKDPLLFSRSVITVQQIANNAKS